MADDLEAFYAELAQVEAQPEEPEAASPAQVHAIVLQGTAGGVEKVGGHLRPGSGRDLSRRP